MKKTQQFKRKKLFIQPAFQGRFILWGIVAIILASVLSAVLLYFLLTAFYESQNQSAHILLTESWHRLGMAIIVANCVALLVGVALVSWIVLHRSHKIAGPLYRFCQLFNKIGQGDLSQEVHLREDDELNAVAEALQTMIEQLRTQRERRLALIQSALDKACDNATPEALAQIRQVLEELHIQENNKEE